MSQLIKKLKTTVIPGTAAVVSKGTPGSPAYTSVRTVFKEAWVTAPGITWVWEDIPRVEGMSGYWGYERTSDGQVTRKWFPFTTEDSLLGHLGGTWVPLYLGSKDLGNQPVTVKSWVTVLESTEHPAVPAKPGVILQPATENQISYSLNVGWNSYAISKAPLNTGKFLVFNVESGSTGAFLGIGPTTLYGNGVSAYKHGLVIEPTGIAVMESGKTKGTLINTRFSDCLIRIHRQANNTIVYVATLWGETHVIASQVSPDRGDLYVHPYLYSGGDVVFDPEYKTGKVIFGGTK